jgi:type VI secretion system protein ImpH
MLALIGLGTPGMSGRLHGVPDESLLPYAPLFQENARPTIGLERLLSSYFRISVSVQSFVGRWVRLATDDQTRLGRFGQHHQLGNGAITGQRIWDVSNSLQIQIGPLEYADFQTWLPDQKQMLRLMELMRLYLRDSLDFEVQLLLNPRQAPPLQLTRKRSPRLGWNCWLGTNRQQSGDCRFSSSRFPSSLGG